ncbi:MAG: recombinase family protein [Bacteroidales bacterium]|nr:recombinase family protein [Bacteroidales bacterium]
MFRYYNFAEMFKPEDGIMYLRKSRADDPLLSVGELLEKHEIDIDSWCERNIGGKIAQSDRYYEVVSGEKISERFEFQKVLKEIENPRKKFIACYDVSRLSRGDLEDAGKLIKLLRYTSTYVITTCPQYVYDLSDADDREKFERELKQGNMYLEYFKKISNNGRLLSVSQGWYICSQPPYGFNRIKVMDGKRERPTLEENKEQADVVRLIFDLYVNKNMGRINICHYLDSLKIPAPRGKQWSHHSIKDMLANIHYIGKVKWQEKKTVMLVEDGNIRASTRKSKMGDYLIFEGKHDAIISQELFYAAQDKIGRNHRAKPNTKVRNPLAGLIFCQCGRAMSLRTYKNKDGSMRNVPRLLCDGQVYCKTSSALYEEMLDLVRNILQEEIENIKLHIESDDGNSVKLHQQLINNLEKKLKNLQEKELSQWEQQSHPDPAQRMPPEIFKRLNERLIAEKEETQQAIKSAYETMPESIDYAERYERFKVALETLNNPDANPELQNILLKRCIDRITYSREKAERVKSQQERYYDKEQKKTRYRSPLKTGGNWTSNPIELDVKLRV